MLRPIHGFRIRIINRHSNQQIENGAELGKSASRHQTKPIRQYGREVRTGSADDNARADKIEVFFAFFANHAFLVQHLESFLIQLSDFEAKMAAGVFSQGEIDPDRHGSKIAARPSEHSINAVPIFINRGSKRSQERFRNKAYAIEKIALARTITANQKP